MKIKFSFLSLLLSLVTYPQRSGEKDILGRISIDSIEKILILDSYNDNYEREWGRKYIIEPKTDGYEIFKVEEYYRNYEFDENEVQFDSLKLLKEMGISKSNSKELTKQVNERSRQRVLIKERMDSIVWGTSERPENWKGKKSFGKIENKTIDELIAIIKSERSSPYTYLKVNGIDSIWLEHNYERLYNKWIELHPNYKKNSRKEISLALKDFKIFKKSFISSLLTGGFTRYPYMNVSVFYENSDSITLTSRGQGYFQLPWNFDHKKLYNPHLSILMSNLIPNEKFYSINKRLNPNWAEVEKAILEKMLSVYSSEQRRKK